MMMMMMITMMMAMMVMMLLREATRSQSNHITTQPNHNNTNQIKTTKQIKAPPGNPRATGNQSKGKQIKARQSIWDARLGLRSRFDLNQNCSDRAGLERDARDTRASRAPRRPMNSTRDTSSLTVRPPGGGGGQKPTIDKVK